MARVLQSLAVAAACLVFGACASSEVSERRSNVANERLPRPQRIVVCDFVGGGAGSPLNTFDRNCADQRSRRMLESERLTRELGSLIANEMIAEVNRLGVRGERAFQGPPPAINDILLTGEFVELDAGNRAARVLVGFGAGAAELKTLVQAYQVTPTGLRPLGLAEINSEGGKMPGILVTGAAGAVAGTVGSAVVVGSAVATGKEIGPESIQAAARRTAEQIRDVLASAFQRQGWN